MRLLIPILFYRKGGVERVIVALINSLVDHCNCIVLVLPEKHLLYFKNLLPDSDKIVYERLNTHHSTPAHSLSSSLAKIANLLKRLGLNNAESTISKYAKNQKINRYLNQLVSRYEITHCIYLLTNRIEPPNLSIPLTMLAHDMFWRFAPLSYSDPYIKEYDKSLLKWLKKSSIVFTNSHKTKHDILSIFPEFKSKLKSVPLAGFAQPREENFNSKNDFLSENSSNQVPIFFFPSSFGIYKDHLTLIKAGLKLVEKEYEFKIVLIGKETDTLLKGELQLSQQSKTKEYSDYLRQWHKIYSQNHKLIHTYFEGLGYCDYSKVEYLYENCSCVVVPSKYEGFGLAVSEAVVRGLPVIASDLQVFREQADLYNCHDRISFFKQGDADELAAYMEQFILQPKPHLSREESHQRFSHWTWQDVAKQYVDVLQGLEHLSPY